MFRSLLAASAMTFAAAFLTPAVASETKMPRTISMTGHGEVRVAPDRAMITAGVNTTGVTAEAALKANAKAMNAVMAKLKAAGVAEKLIQTTNFSVQPHYDYGESNKPPKLSGYDVINNVSVTVEDINSLGSLLDALVAAGSNQVNGVTFSVADPQNALDEARKLAVKDATRKAGVYATAASLGLGDIMLITEGVNIPPPIAMMDGMERTAAAKETPIAEGEQALSVDVTIIWEIK